MYFLLPEYFVKLFRCVRQKGAEGNLPIRFLPTKRFKTETNRNCFLHQASCYNFKLVKLHKSEYAVLGIP